jgi:hypothetical protein
MQEPDSGDYIEERDFPGIEPRSAPLRRIDSRHAERCCVSEPEAIVLQEPFAPEVPDHDPAREVSDHDPAREVTDVDPARDAPDLDPAREAPDVDPAREVLDVDPAPQPEVQVQVEVPEPENLSDEETFIQEQEPDSWIERILSYRAVGEEEGKREFLVKVNGRSYRDAQWVAEARVETEQPELRERFLAEFPESPADPVHDKQWEIPGRIIGKEKGKYKNTC